MQGFHGGTAKSVHYCSLFVDVPIKSAKAIFSEITVLATEKTARTPSSGPRREQLS
jgi:hypothetical protein